MAYQRLRLPLALGAAVLFLAIGRTAPAADLALDYRQITLKNGLRVLSLEDANCPIVAVQLWFHVGSRNELPERQGFAHMFEHMMFRGTDRLGSTDHFDLIRRTGGSCNAYTSFDNTVYVQQVPANQLELVLWLEAERLGFLRIDQTNFDTERKVVEEERRLGLNRPYGTLPEKLMAEIFPSHPYRWLPIGKIPHLRATHVQELRDFSGRYYVPNNATLVVVGAVKHEEVQRLAKRYFEWLPREGDPPPAAGRDPLPTKARTVSIREDNAPAPAAGLVWRTVPSRHDDYVPLQLLGTILGGGNSSRLYREIVAEKQLGVAAIAAAFSLEEDGLFGAAAVMVPFRASQDKVLTAIRKHVEEVPHRPVTAAELTKARNQMLAGIVASSLTVESKASLLGNAAVIEGDAARINRRLSRIRAVTVEDLQRVAQTYLSPERSLTVKVEQNLLGTVLSQFLKNREDEAPITAKSETTKAPPTRPGLRRPADFPAAPPIAPLAEPRFPRDQSTRTLANGLKVYMVPRHQVPYVNVQLHLRGGAWTEDRPGTASLALGMLTHGTAAHTEKQLAEELENYAIDLSGASDMDAASVSMGCLSEHFERALNLTGEVVLTPAFPVEEFEKVRKQVRTGLAITEAEPSTIASRELDRRLYGVHPYGRPVSGTVKDLDALKVEDLRRWWQQFGRPEDAVLIVAGDVEAEQAFRLAEKVFGAWKRAGASANFSLPAFPEARAKHIYLVDRPGVQSQIRIGQRSIQRGDPLYAASRVVNGYFGDGFGSRLNKAVRVKKGLTYGARGAFSAARFSGSLSLSSFSKTETTAEAVKTMLDELSRLQTEPPSAEELNDTRSYLAGKVAGDRETPSAVARDLWQIELEGLPADYHEKLLRAITATSAADCTKLVRDKIDPARLVIVVVGPAETLRKDLEKIAPVTVVTRETLKKPE